MKVHMLKLWRIQMQKSYEKKRKEMKTRNIYKMKQTLSIVKKRGEKRSLKSAQWRAMENCVLLSTSRYGSFFNSNTQQGAINVCNLI
jgi:type I restriction-modification system DNA methylase subunit